MPRSAIRTPRRSIYLALASAKEKIELTSAYFVPRPAFTDALVEAAERGVDMRILVPGSHIDKEFVRTAGRAAYEQLLEVGMRLFEYGPTMLHAKSLVIDDVWSCVGSINFDNRSFQLHDEIALCVQSQRFAERAARAVRARPRGLRGDRARQVGRARAARSGPASWSPSTRAASCSAGAV